MTKVLIKKDIPSTGFGYTGGGAGTKIQLELIEIISHTKKSLVKFTIPKTKSKQTPTTSGGENVYGNVIDLKKIEESIVLRCWLEDDATETAWNKYWKIRAMTTVGGALSYLRIKQGDFDILTDGETDKDILLFSSNTTGMSPNIEDLTGSIKPDDTGSINTSAGTGTARIEITLNILLGDIR